MDREMKSVNAIAFTSMEMDRLLKLSVFSFHRGLLSYLIVSL